MNKDNFILGDGIYYDGVLNEIKKSSDQYKPIFEAFTNSLEAIKLALKEETLESKDSYITIKLHFESNNVLFKESYSETMTKIIIEDNGIGFDDTNFERLKRYKDNRKGYNNKGSGRIQLLHYFGNISYTSIFKEDGKFKERKFSMSKSYIKPNNNAIIKVDGLREVETSERQTTLILEKIIDEKDRVFYSKITTNELKRKLINRYILEFCIHKEELPRIKIEKFLDGSRVNEEEQIIVINDIPALDREEDITVQYVTIDGNNELVQMEKNEKLKMIVFKIDKDKLEKNEIKITSKGEIIEGVKVELKNLKETDFIENSRYLFLLSGDYIDDKDVDIRGTFNIPNKKDFIRSGHLFCREEILIEDIQVVVNKKIIDLYPEIKDKFEEHNIEIDKLKKMFLFNEEVLNDISISLNDTDSKILERVYVSEMKMIAKKDAEIKSKIDQLDNLNPADEGYNENLNSMVLDLVKKIPIQNKTALTHYVARRKLVLDLFDKILNKEIEVQNLGKRSMDEKLLHNLIFQQTSTNTEESDLWLVNEEFIYFKGASERKIGDIELDGKKILKEDLTEEEKNYKLSLGENRYSKRTDVLLFPSEGKCVIIEFKNLDENISDHLNQITNYASLIRNLSKEEFNFTQFYGYLIGEKMNIDDIQAKNPYFQGANNFEYAFLANYPIIGKFGRTNGSLYMEAIKYSTLLERAKIRNEIFIKKLTENY